MFKLLSTLSIGIIAASSVAGFVVPRKEPPANWAFGYLEDYNVYHTRYLALKCQTQHGKPFFDQCCHPLLATETLQTARPPQCIPSVAASSSAAAAEPTSTVSTPADNSDDCDDESDEGDDDDEDCDDEPDASSAPAATPTPQTPPAPVTQAPPAATPTPQAPPAGESDEGDDDDDDDCDDEPDASSAPAAAPTPQAPPPAPATQAPPAATPTPQAPPAAPSPPKAAPTSAAVVNVAPDPPAATPTAPKASPKPQPPAPASQPPAPKASPAAPSPAPSSDVITGGFATFFFQNGVAGACGTVHFDSDIIVAMDIDRYGNTGVKSPFCGKQVKITNTQNGKSVTATIADACPTCNNGNSYDLSQGAFNLIADPATGIVPITWSFV